MDYMRALPHDKGETNFCALRSSSSEYTPTNGFVLNANNICILYIGVLYIGVDPGRCGGGGGGGGALCLHTKRL